MLAKKTTAATYQATQGGSVLANLLWRPNVEKAFAIKCSQFESQVCLLSDFSASHATEMWKGR